MKYYQMFMDRDNRHPVVLEGFLTGESAELHKEDLGRLADSTILFTAEDENTIYTDMLDAPVKMASDMAGDVIAMHDETYLTRRVSLINRQKDTRYGYQMLLADRIDCLHESSEFYKDRSIKKLVLDSRKIKGREFFRIGGISPDIVVVSLKIAESILRRNGYGIVFEEIECRGD